MSGGKLLYLVCYDIRCPKRLGRVHRYLKKRAVALQYSVFLAKLSVKEREALLSGLRVIIHEQFDDVRVYPLPKSPDWCTLGKPLWDEGLQFYGVELPPQVR